MSRFKVWALCFLIQIASFISLFLLFSSLFCHTLNRDDGNYFLLRICYQLLKTTSPTTSSFNQTVIAGMLLHHNWICFKNFFQLYLSYFDIFLDNKTHHSRCNINNDFFRNAFISLYNISEIIECNVKLLLKT